MLKPITAPAKPADATAEVEAMIARLSALQSEERGEKLRHDYGVVLERMSALAHRLAQFREKPIVFGGSPTVQKSIAASALEPVQRPLPIEPIMIAKPPRRKR